MKLDNLFVRPRKFYTDYQNNLRIVESTKLVGEPFIGTTLDTNFWVSTLINGGTVSQSNGKLILRTNTTANGSSIIKSVQSARLINGFTNYYKSSFRFTAAGTTNNKIKFGVFDGTDGFFYQFNGTTSSIGYTANTSETLINSGSFKSFDNMKSWTPNANTEIHTLEIYYSNIKAEFYIDGIHIHTFSSSIAPLITNMNLPIYFEITNSNSITTDIQFEVLDASIIRLGKNNHQPIYKNISGASTTVCKYSAGEIKSIWINSAVAGTITIYDNTSASGTIISTYTTPASNIATPILIDIPYYLGLTIVTDNAGHNLTILYE